MVDLASLLERASSKPGAVAGATQARVEMGAAPRRRWARWELSLPAGAAGRVSRERFVQIRPGLEGGRIFARPWVGSLETGPGRDGRASW